MSSPQVAVYLLATDMTSPLTDRVMNLFSNPLFSLGVANVSPPENLQVPASGGLNPVTTDMSSEDAITNYRINWCLDNAAKNHPDSYVIIVKDTSTSEASPDRIADIVTAATSSGDWDVCYLSKWHDRCDLYSNKRPITGTSTTIAKTSSPHGLQAVIFSPAGRDMVLGRHPLRDGSTFPTNQRISAALHNAIMNGQIEATCTVPNLISYDPLVATKDADFAKTQECEIPNGPNSGRNSLQQNGSSSNWLWWLIIIILVLLLLYVLYRWSKKNRAVVVA
jgi:hypothetical protein